MIKRFTVVRDNLLHADLPAALEWWQSMAICDHSGRMYGPVLNDQEELHSYTAAEESMELFIADVTSAAFVSRGGRYIRPANVGGKG